MSNNSYTLGQLKKIEKIVVKDSADNINKVIFPNDVQIGAGSQLPSTLNVGGEIKGYIHKLSDGSSYLIAGANVTITSGSDGSITISSSGGGGGGGGSGDITSVVAGNGLTGGATTGDATLNVGAGTGIDVAADAISVDVSDFLTNGSDNRIITATGTDAMNAEANLTFDGNALAVAGTLGINANVSGDFAAIIDNDHGTSGHGLKITSDGVGGGTKILDLESASTTFFIARGDQKIGIGKVTSLPDAKLTVSSSNTDSDIAIAHKIHHIADPDTYITFEEEDAISLTAGNKNMLSLNEAGANTQTLIMSGGAENSYDEASGSDVSFYVSGSSNSRGRSTRGTSVFGGDLAISGSLWPLSKPGFTYCDVHGYMSSAPSGDPTIDFHLQWYNGLFSNNDAEIHNSNFYWKYFPYGGEIVSVFANGSNVGNSSTSNPFTKDLVVALYTRTDNFVSDSNPHSGGVVGHMTASATNTFASPDGGSTYQHRALYDFTNAPVNGSFVIPAGQIAAFAIKGEGLGDGFDKLNVNIVYKLGLKS